MCQNQFAETIVVSSGCTILPETTLNFTHIGYASIEIGAKRQALNGIAQKRKSF